MTTTTKAPRNPKQATESYLDIDGVEIENKTELSIDTGRNTSSSTIDSSEVETEEPGLLTCTISWKMLNIASDSECQKVCDLFAKKEAFHVEALDTVAGKGVKGDFKLIKCKPAPDGKGVSWFECEAKPCASENAFELKGYKTPSAG